MTLKLPPIVLASASPRRSQILDSVGWSFTKQSADIDETVSHGENPRDYVERLAIGKADVIAANHKESIVLGADTTVVVDDQIIGKPVDTDDARRMIRLLAGKWHEVLTGIAVSHRGHTTSDVVTTRVKFAPMTKEEIDFLAVEGDPLDKAGAYAVQAQAALFIEGIEGDYWNVVGLPIKSVYDLIMKKPG